MKKIEVITIPVSDQQKAKEFYLKLGFQKIADEPMGEGKNWIQLGLPGQATSISLVSFHGVIFETDDIEKEIRELNKIGIETGQIDITPWGMFSQFKDPSGNGLSLHQK